MIFVCPLTSLSDYDFNSRRIVLNTLRKNEKKLKTFGKGQ